MQLRLAFGRWAINVTAGREPDKSMAASIYEEVLEEVFGTDVGLIVTPQISLN